MHAFNAFCIWSLMNDDVDITELSLGTGNITSSPFMPLSEEYAINN